ncbi:HNH endonuclease signature motif containing protein [Streptomyces sp. NPDC056257]|uniref:HNH endonuclease signature motif containing protein n=1 Tax=Streptomyces sp. NPDC056257 TaxID=3345765 RepID=UPI0035D5413C
MYCYNQATSMDHVIPFARGGADDLSNLVPICDRCNRLKGDRTPVEWATRVFMNDRWSGDGTVQAGGRPGGLSLRELHTKAHEEGLEVLDAVEKVLTEIANVERWRWFLWSTSINYPGTVGIEFYRSFMRDRIKVAEAAGWPEVRPAHYRT